MARDDSDILRQGAAVTVKDVTKEFVMHLRDGARIPVVQGLSFELSHGECVALMGPSGAGKSSVLQSITRAGARP